MVAYNAFNVDPQRYQQNTMANIANAARYSSAINQQARQNAFAEQQARAQAEENAFNRTLKVREENRATRKEGREQSAEKRDSLKFKYEMMGKQVDDFGRILDTVTDPRTHEMARTEVANRVQSGLLPPQFLDRFPQQYDPMALSYGKQFINGLKQKIASDYANITTVDESGITRVRPYKKTEGIELEKGEKTAKQSESWGEPYRDEAGNLVQKNLATGKISKVSTPTKGMEITTAEGTTIRTGVPQGPGQPTKAVTTELQKKQVGNIESLNRIGNIIANFKPEYQQVPTKLGIKWSSLKSKFDMGDVSDEEKATLQDFASYKQDSLENINLYIKEITGAQMSEKEAGRLRKAIPDPGEGVFDGDDPVTFRSKMVNVYKKTRAAIARYNYYLNQGIDEGAIKTIINSGGAVSLANMEKLIDEHAETIKKDNPSMSRQDVIDRVSSDFGLK